MFLLFVFSGADLIAVDHIFGEQELRCHIDQHGHDQHDVFVHAFSRHVIAEDRGNRREDEVIAEDLQHGDRDVRRRFEGERAVEGEIPDDRKDERDEIKRSVLVLHDPAEQLVFRDESLHEIGFQKKLVHQREGAELDDARRGGEEDEFDELNEIGFLFVCHGAFPFFFQNVIWTSSPFTV